MIFSPVKLNLIKFSGRKNKMFSFLLCLAFLINAFVLTTTVTSTIETSNDSVVDILVFGSLNDESIEITIKTLEITLASPLVTFSVIPINSYSELNRYLSLTSDQSNVFLVGHSDEFGFLKTNSNPMKLQLVQSSLRIKSFESISYISCSADEFISGRYSNEQYLATGIIDGRVGAIEASLKFWESVVREKPYSEAIQKYNQIKEIVELEFFTGMKNDPIFTLFENPLSESNPSSSLLNELRYEWELYTIANIKNIEIDYGYDSGVKNGIPWSYEFTSYSTMYDQYDLHKGETLFSTPIVPVQTLVVVDDDLKSFYGNDYAHKVKRNLETWDAPFTAQFGIALNVRTVINIPQVHNGQFLTGPNFLRECLVPVLGLCVDFYRDVYMSSTESYYMDQQREGYVEIGLPGGIWDDTVGAPQGYDLLIILLKYPRDDGQRSPTGGFAYEGNKMLITLDHQAWHPQLMFLHELGHVYGAEHAIGVGERIAGKDMSSIPDGVDDNSAAAAWQPEDFLLLGTLDTNFDESVNDYINDPHLTRITSGNNDWYIDTRNYDVFSGASMLSYYDNYLLSKGIFVSGDTQFTILKSNGNTQQAYYSPYGNRGDTYLGYQVVSTWYKSYQTTTDIFNKFLLDFINWEEIKGNRLKFASSDLDGDGLSNLEEWNANTDMSNTDTDNDGLSDYEEVNSYNTNPLKADTDIDGLSDKFEIFGWNNYFENEQGFLEWIHYDSNPLDTNSDNDNLNDYEEWDHHTNPRDSDTDSDGLSDSLEISGWIDIDSSAHHTSDPLVKNTDGDILRDDEENIYGYDPRNSNDPVPNIAPVAYSIGGPSSGVTGAFYQFSFKATDANQESLYYQIKWGSSGWYTYGPYASGTTLYKTRSFSSSGSHTIQFRAYDLGRNYQSPLYSTTVTKSFSTSSTPPPCYSCPPVFR